MRNQFTKPILATFLIDQILYQIPLFMAHQVKTDLDMCGKTALCLLHTYLLTFQVFNQPIDWNEVDLLSAPACIIKRAEPKIHKQHGAEIIH